MSEFKTFKDLDLWQVAREFRKRICRLSRLLPSDERFNLTSQMRRAGLSLTNNIAEGHGRYHYQENIQFLRQSRGSLEELLDDLTLCTGENYLAPQEIKAAEEEAARVRLLLNKYIGYLKQKKVSTGLTARELPAEYGVDDEDEEL